MNRYQAAAAARAINGYFVARKPEAMDATFSRAKAEAAAAFRQSADQIDALDLTQYAAALKQDAARHPQGHAAIQAALEDLMTQLEGVGIAQRGRDEGQWADAAGLSFRQAWEALGVPVETIEPSEGESDAEGPKCSWHFDLGNSSVGPIGMAGRVHATSARAAVERIRELLPESIDVFRDTDEMEDGEYAQVYLNPNAITSAAIDDCHELE